MDTESVKEIVRAIGTEIVVPLSHRVDALNQTIMESWHKPENCPLKGEVDGLKIRITEGKDNQKIDKSYWRTFIMEAFKYLLVGGGTLLLAIMAKRMGLPI